MNKNNNFPAVNPTQTSAWKALESHFKEMKNRKMQSVFSEDPERAGRLSLVWNDFFIDFSKNRITDKTLSLLVQLAEETKLKEAVEMCFSGEKINTTEKRAVLHSALRDFDSMKPEVEKTLHRMKSFSEKVISGTYKGFSGKAITDVVNIGIGGSHLGPEMVVEALKFYRNHLNIHFIANIDGDAGWDILSKLNPETTLFIVVSKSFTTQETLTNASEVKKWFLQKTNQNDISKHFIAVSGNSDEVKKFGILEEHTFKMNDWVGGRFSLWSAVGLSICCAIGYSHFESLLKGAHAMDLHFQSESFEKNIPVLLGLISIWYANFFKTETEGIVAYSQYLNKLVPYLQQASMESNGKSVDRNGNPVDYQTGTIIWGDVGSNAQHAFFQLLHQGTSWAPMDFIGFSESLYNREKNHNILMANFFAQTEALWEGNQHNENKDPHRNFEGNRPSNTILIKKLTPKNLGSLIALYEHKIFVQGVVWNICSFDQWGVELGKTVAKETLNSIEKRNSESVQNGSTKNLIQKFLAGFAQKK